MVLSIASRQFVAEVQKFEILHKKSISDLLTARTLNPSTENEALIREFFANPIIHRYLARRSDSIRFSENKPYEDCLTSVELAIYKIRSDVFAFRNQADNPDFYKDGPKAGAGDNFFSSLQKRYNNSSIEITPVMDIHKIRNYLNNHNYSIKYPHPGENIREKFKFILTPNWSEGGSIPHATIMVHILEPETGEVLASVFVNSWQSDDYTSTMSYRFNIRARNSFSPEAQGKFDIFQGTKGGIEDRDIPFIDASHPLQTTKGDPNCTLYGYNFLEAIARMLNNADEAEEILNLARLANAKVPVPDASAKLQNIFQEKLKAYLLCYYNVSGEKKAPSEIRKFHLAQRWDLGSDILSSIYPSSEEIIFRYKSIKTFKSTLDHQDKTLSVQYLGNNQVVQYVFDHVIPNLQNEKIRLLQKYPPVANGRNIASERISILEFLLDSIYEELADFENKPQANAADLKQKLKTIIITELQLKSLDKYQNWGKKLALVLLNALFCLPLITVPIKKLVTGSWFFSLKGKTQEANGSALDQMSTAPEVNAIQV